MHPIVARSIFWPTFAWNVWMGRVLKRRRWWDRVDDNVILGAMPFRRDVASLHKVGVRGVINMCREYGGPLDLYQRNGIEQLWLPTIDFQPPSLEDVERGVTFLDKFAVGQDQVYVHCKAGRARSATIVICWLVKTRKMTLPQAQEHLLSCRAHVNAKLCQRQVVMAYCKNQE